MLVLFLLQMGVALEVIRGLFQGAHHSEARSAPLLGADQPQTVLCTLILESRIGLRVISGAILRSWETTRSRGEAHFCP